jgi:hypothetical protein
MINRILEHPVGSVVVSIILGLGLAALFRKACTDNRCIVIKGPPVKEIQQFHYKLNDDCYKYEPYVVDCEENDKKEEKYTEEISTAKTEEKLE